MVESGGDMATSPRSRGGALAEQTRVTRRYDRLAAVYDLYNGPLEWLSFRRRRRRLLSGAEGLVLDAGIGTGLSLRHYPPGVEVIGVDVSPRMLRRARRRAVRLSRPVRLGRADVQRLPFLDQRFDTVVATFLFCSVPNPVGGLSELRRVVKPDGRVLLLEHVRPRNRFLGWLSDLVSPITRRLLGFNLNRRTEDNILAAGLELVTVRRRGIWREIVARPGPRRARPLPRPSPERNEAPAGP